VTSRDCTPENTTMATVLLMAGFALNGSGYTQTL
jgi:hypothetical protein